MLPFRGIVPGILSLALTTSVPAGAATSPIIIVNSGSTNTLGFTINVAADGGSMLTMQRQMKTFQVSTATLKKLLNDLAAAKKASTSPGSGCIKSASFGSATRITWQGWTSPDLECPASNPQTAALIDDVHAVREAAGIAAPTLHSRAAQSEPTASP